jgi:glucose-1-phosphate thymidylyltransferase
VSATIAVVLARGLGSRMRAVGDAAADVRLDPAQRTAADAGAKGLIPVAGRPLLDHVLEALEAGGVRTVVFVVAPGEQQLRARYGAGAGWSGLQVRFAEQAEPRGTADALRSAREAVGRADFLMLNADNLYPAESVAALVALDGPGLVAYEANALVAESNIDRARVMQFALLDIGADEFLRGLVEKPDADHPLARAREHWVSMNLWRFTSDIFDDCAAVTPSPRGELELADAVRHAITVRGERFRVVRQRAGVLDLSRRGDVAAVEALLRARGGGR